jgi:hypothetical protein
MGKIFCIGFKKTGSTTVGKALASLGYRHTSFNREVWQAYQARDIAKVLMYMKDFESADDAPWHKIDMIPLLDETFPGSRFIYLSRDEDSWKNSVVNWTLKMTGIQPNIQDYLNDYLAHRDFVDQYFVGDKAAALVRIDVGEPGSFNQLKTFLGFPSGGEEFPHFNKTSKLDRPRTTNGN